MIRKYIRKYWFHYLLGIIVLTLVDFLNLYIPQYTGEVTDYLMEGKDMREIGKLIGKILLVGSGLALGRFGWRYFIFGSARKIEYELRGEMFRHLSSLSMRYYNENKTGDLMAHFTNDLGAIRQSVGMAVISTFDGVIMTIMVIVKMIFHVNLTLTLLALFPMLVILAGGVFYGGAAQRRFAAKQKAFSDMTDQVQETISGIRIVKAFVQEKREKEAFEKVNRNNQEKNLGVVKLQAVIMPLLDVIIGISGVIALLYGGKLVLDGALSPGQFVAFHAYVGMLVWPMLAVGDSITSFSQGLAAMHRIDAIFAQKPEIVDGADVRPDLQSVEGEITVNHLNFSYEEGLEPAIKELSLRINKGETLAILGRTGSGKTTFANLLVRMYDVEKGMLCLDGHALSEFPLHVLRESVAYVPQDNFLFSDTLQSNIAFGVRKISDVPEEALMEESAGAKLLLSRKERLEEYMERDFFRTKSRVDEAYADLDDVQAAAKKAAIHDNIMEFPKQYATMVGERGVTISGGQKQRSAIARALMKDAPVLILDDALSAVDTDTEERILNSLKENRRGKTTILIAHRISTIQHADHILVLEHGEMAEYGTHAQLLEKGGIYAKLYEKQQLEKQINTTV